jgi:hypothetical protein
MTTSGMEPATFRLVAYSLNQLRYQVPLLEQKKGPKSQAIAADRDS